MISFATVVGSSLGYLYDIGRRGWKRNRSEREEGERARLRKWVKTRRHGSAQCPNDGGCISRLIFPLFPLFSHPRRGVNFRPFGPFVRTCREPGGLARPTRRTCEIEMKALQSNQDASAGDGESAGVCD